MRADSWSVLFSKDSHLLTYFWRNRGLADYCQQCVDGPSSSIGALWVIRANLQRSNAVKQMFFYIFPFWFHIWWRNIYSRWRNPYSGFWVDRVNVEGARIFYSENRMIWSNRSRSSHKNNVSVTVSRLMPSSIHLKTLVTTEKGVSLLTVLVSSRKRISEWKYEDKRIFCRFVSLQSCPDYP